MRTQDSHCHPWIRIELQAKLYCLVVQDGKNLYVRKKSDETHLLCVERSHTTRDDDWVNFLSLCLNFGTQGQLKYSTCHIQTRQHTMMDGMAAASCSVSSSGLSSSPNDPHCIATCPRNSMLIFLWLNPLGDLEM